MGMVSKDWEHPWSAAKALMLQRQLSQFRGKGLIVPSHPPAKPVWSAGCPSAAGQQCNFEASGPESKVYLPDSSLSSECKRCGFCLSVAWVDPVCLSKSRHSWLGRWWWWSWGRRCRETVHVETFLCCCHWAVLCSYPVLLSNALVMNSDVIVNAV